MWQESGSFLVRRLSAIVLLETCGRASTRTNPSDGSDWTRAWSSPRGSLESSRETSWKSAVRFHRSLATGIDRKDRANGERFTSRINRYSSKYYGSWQEELAADVTEILSSSRLGWVLRKRSQPLVTAIESSTRGNQIHVQNHRYRHWSFFASDSFDQNHTQAHSRSFGRGKWLLRSSRLFSPFVQETTWTSPLSWFSDVRALFSHPSGRSALEESEKMNKGTGRTLSKGKHIRAIANDRFSRFQQVQLAWATWTISIVSSIWKMMPLVTTIRTWPDGHFGVKWIKIPRLSISFQTALSFDLGPMFALSAAKKLTLKKEGERYWSATIWWTLGSQAQMSSHP